MRKIVLAFVVSAISLAVSGAVYSHHGDAVLEDTINQRRVGWSKVFTDGDWDVFEHQAS